MPKLAVYSVAVSIDIPSITYSQFLVSFPFSMLEWTTPRGLGWCGPPGADFCACARQRPYMAKFSSPYFLTPEAAAHSLKC